MLQNMIFGLKPEHKFIKYFSLKIYEEETTDKAVV